jgi:hypothetical protein
MERIMKLFNREYSQIAEAALVLGFFTFISQILAIFRDRFLAGNIGAGSTLDMYSRSYFYFWSCTGLCFYPHAIFEVTTREVKNAGKRIHS